MRLPNALVGLLFVAGLVLVGVAALTSFDALPLLPTDGQGILANPVLVALIGVVLGAGLSLAIAGLYSAVRKAEGFGMGDVKLLGAIGVFVGPYVLLVLFVASVVGALWMVPAGRVKGWRAKMPFGPFIAGATLLVIAFGEPLWHWYATLARLA